MTVGWLLRYAAWARPQGLAQINCSAHGPIKTLPSFNHRRRVSPVWPSGTGVRLVLVITEEDLGYIPPSALLSL